MPRLRKYGPKILELLNKEPLTRPEITKKLEIDRKTVWDNLKWAEKKNLIYSVLGKYRLTPLGKYHLSTHEKPNTDSSLVLTDSISFEVTSQVIDSLKIREESPKAKCTVQMKDAEKIKELDDKTIYYERFITHDGLGLPENDTYLKQAVADVVDVILDFRAKAKGALTILDQELRDKATVFNTDTYYPAFDYRKRYEDLAAIDFAVLIEFKGKKWVESQKSTNLESDLENSLEANRELYVQTLRKIRSADQNIRISKAIYNIMGGSGRRTLTKKSLEANRLFYSSTALRDYIRNWFRAFQVDQLHVEDIIRKGFKSGYFEIEKKNFYHLKFNKDKKLPFFNSIPLNNHLRPSNMEDIQGRSRNQKSEADNNLGIDDIVSKVSIELDFFEKAFFDLLIKLVERFEKAKMQDKVVDTSQIRDGKQPLHLINAEKALSQLIYLFQTVVNGYILHFMKLVEKGIVDEQLQSKGILFIITKLANMRRAARQVLNSFRGGHFNTLFYDNFYDEKMIQSHATTFKDAGIIGEAEPLLQSVTQIYKKLEWGA